MEFEVNVQKTAYTTFKVFKNKSTKRTSPITDSKHLYYQGTMKPWHVSIT